MVQIYYFFELCMRFQKITKKGENYVNFPPFSILFLAELVEEVVADVIRVVAVCHPREGHPVAGQRVCVALRNLHECATVVGVHHIHQREQCPAVVLPLCGFLSAEALYGRE